VPPTADSVFNSESGILSNRSASIEEELCEFPDELSVEEFVPPELEEAESPFPPHATAENSIPVLKRAMSAIVIFFPFLIQRPPYVFIEMYFTRLSKTAKPNNF